MKTVNTYRKLHDPSTKLPRSSRLALLQLAERRVGSTFLYSAIMQSDYWIGKAYHFKELIVQKYTRMTLMQAKRAYQDSGCAMPMNDVIQIFLIYLDKAICRCDSRQGVLTTYIQNWFYSAKSEVMKAVAKDGLSSSYDQMLEDGVDVLSVSPDTQFEAIQHLCHVAKSLDPTGAYRFALNIPESFSAKDLRKLSLFTTT